MSMRTVRRKTSWLTITLVAGGMMGCAGLQAISSGHVGCAEDEIVITNEDGSWGSRTWIAQCRGKRFFCSATQTGKDNSQVSCKEEVSDKEPEVAVAAPPPPRPQPAGCQFDTQCKGDRICVKGKCVTPQKSADPAPAKALPQGEVEPLDVEL